MLSSKVQVASVLTGSQDPWAEGGGIGNTSASSSAGASTMLDWGTLGSPDLVVAARLSAVAQRH